MFASGRITYSFAAAGAEYAVFLEANSGGGTILVKDSVSNVQVAQISDLAGGPGLESQVSNNFSGPRIFLLEMVGGMPDSTRFRFYIYTVNRAPESRSARFALGDTVSGESIDHLPDVDDFFLEGHAGQYLVGWIEPLGPLTTSPQLSMVIVDPPFSNQIGNTSGVIGQSPRQLFRVGPLPNDRDYRFTVPGFRVIGTAPYTGPYRFHAYAIDPAPEGGESALPFNTVVTGAIDVAGDIDAFTFPADSGEEFNVFVQSVAARSITGSIVGPTQGLLQSPTSVAGDTGIFLHGSGRFRTMKDTTFGISVYGQAYEDATGSYRLYLYRINRAPETIAAVVPIGDTISGEAIDVPGDRDEFTFFGTAGDQVNVFVQAESASTNGVSFQLFNPNGQLMSGVASNGPGTGLLAEGTGRLTLPTSGIYQLRFDGAVGSYRFLIYRINPQPETHSAVLALRDSVENESIDVPGDVDEFSFTAPDSSGFTLFFDGHAAGGVEVSLHRAGSAEQIGFDYNGTFVVGPGSYVLRVQSPAYPDVGSGPYQFWMYPRKPTPETANQTIAIGDTVENEQLDPPGDVDIFYFNGIKGQHVNIAFQGTSAPSADGGYTAYLYSATNLMGWVGTPTSSPSLGSQQTTRLDLPATGQYQIRIQGGSSPARRIEHGPYRLAVTTVDTMPESVPFALVPGDSVTTESIDTPGDWDQFTVTATPDEELGLVFTSSATTYYPLILAFNPITRDSLARTVGQFVRFAGPFRVPSSGQAAIGVYEPASRGYQCYDATCGNVFGFTGGYRFNVIRVNRAPETASATYTVGATVQDSIGVGDIDEFTASAAPGSVLTGFLRMRAPPVVLGYGNGLTLEILNPSTGATLAGSGIQVFGQSALVAVGSFSVPASGTFLIRVRGSGTLGDDIITGPYEMVVKP